MFANCAPPQCFPPTGIEILVVGAGLGGLVAAIELFRQGHTVRVIESKADIEELGNNGPLSLKESNWANIPD